jgi:hypothetical protein
LYLHCINCVYCVCTFVCCVLFECGVVFCVMCVIYMLCLIVDHCHRVEKPICSLNKIYNVKSTTNYPSISLLPFLIYYFILGSVVCLSDTMKHISLYIFTYIISYKWDMIDSPSPNTTYFTTYYQKVISFVFLAHGMLN